jgi:ABC-type multidrug transport system fused ATPase/permease subunit
MQMLESQVIEALSGTRVLSAMITPAVLISACGTLIFSTSARMGRIFDRVNVMKGEVEGIVAGTITYADERLAFLVEQINLQKKRASLIHKAMSALYTATAMFVSASLGIAVNMAYGSQGQAWIPTALALLGGFFLFVASALLLYESRFNLKFVTRSIEFIEFLEQKAAEGKAGK